MGTTGRIGFVRSSVPHRGCKPLPPPRGSVPKDTSDASGAFKLPHRDCNPPVRPSRPAGGGRAKCCIRDTGLLPPSRIHTLKAFLEKGGGFGNPRTTTRWRPSPAGRRASRAHAGNVYGIERFNTRPLAPSCQVEFTKRPPAPKCRVGDGKNAPSDKRGTNSGLKGLTFLIY